MSRLLLPAGRHNHALLPITFWPWCKNPNTASADEVSFYYEVSFDDSCQYELPAYQAENVNKLCGVSFGWFPRRLHTWREPQPPLGDDPYAHEWVSPEHWNSARFGWVWSVKQQVWKLLAYCYANGQRNWDAQKRFPEVGFVAPGQAYRLTLRYNRRNGQATFNAYPSTGYVWDGEPALTVQLPANLPLHGWRAGPWFGGSQPAPHTMHLFLTQR